MDSLKVLHNGEKAPRVFSDAEMDRRLTGLRTAMAQRGIDCCVLTSYHNINYFSQFLYCAFARPYGLVITETKITTISANIDAGQPWRQCFGDNLSYTDWQRDNFFVAVRRLVGSARRIGVEYDHLTIEALRKLQGVLPSVELTDIAADVMRYRMIKSSEEITLIRAGARIADLGGTACVEAIAEGVGEHEVALHATEAMVREIARSYPHAELRDTWVWLQSGINTDGAHNPVTSRRLQKGDILSLNCFPMIAGYYTALERTLFLDTIPSDRHRQLWEINCEVHRRGLALIQPGTRCCDIASELNEIYAQHDVLAYRSFGYGHSFGVLSHYYGREAGLELREDVETVLEPGMVVSMEPMLSIPADLPGAGGYREHDILVVEADGAVNITGFPFGPEHNIIAA